MDSDTMEERSTTSKEEEECFQQRQEQIVTNADKCGRMMKMARNDTDRIAVLALIPKMMQQQNRQNKPKQNRRKDQSKFDVGMCSIANSIPIDFLERLFDSTDQDGHILAIRVLALFLTSDEVVSKGIFNGLSTRLVKVFQEALMNSKSSDTAEDDLILDDVIFCCVRLDNEENDLLPQTWRSLTAFGGRQTEEPAKALTAASSLCSNLAALVSSKKRRTIMADLEESGRFVKLQSHLNEFLNVLVGGIRNDQLNPLHFDLLSQLVTLLHKLPGVAADGNASYLQSNNTADHNNNIPWIRDLSTIIRDILQSRHTGDRERRIALSLASTLISVFGLSRWLSNISDHSPQLLLQLIANLASIELRILLDVEGETVFSEVLDPVYIARCCQLLEAVIRYIADSADQQMDQQQQHQQEASTLMMTEKQIMQINGKLLELTDFLLQLFAEMEDRQKQIPNTISFPLYRLVCAYIAEGLALVKKENLTAAAKPLLKLSNYYHHLQKRELVEEVPEEEEATELVEEENYFDNMSLLMPALSELIDLQGPEWDHVKRAFLKNGLTSNLERYLTTQVALEEEKEGTANVILETFKALLEETALT